LKQLDVEQSTFKNNTLIVLSYFYYLEYIK
jgi:hypothetical protein